MKEWNRKIREAQALLIITPEYLHGIPGLLKNALDNVFVSFACSNKPAATVASSTGIAAGSRAVENLAHLTLEAELTPLRNTFIVPFVDTAFDQTGDLTNPMTDAAATTILENLAWWSKALTEARTSGELAPRERQIPMNPRPGQEKGGPGQEKYKIPTQRIIDSGHILGRSLLAYGIPWRGLQDLSPLFIPCLYISIISQSDRPIIAEVDAETTFEVVGVVVVVVGCVVVVVVGCVVVVVVGCVVVVVVGCVVVVVEVVVVELVETHLLAPVVVVVGCVVVVVVGCVVVVVEVVVDELVVVELVVVVEPDVVEPDVKGELTLFETRGKQSTESDLTCELAGNDVVGPVADDEMSVFGEVC